MGTYSMTNGEKIMSSINGTGKTENQYVKEWN